MSSPFFLAVSNILAAGSPWVLGLLGLLLFLGVSALLLNRRFTLLLLGHVLACAMGVAGARLILLSSLGTGISLLCLLVISSPALFGIYRLFVRDRQQTLDYFGY